MAKEWEVGLWNIPNVKANHPEKTIHPCQFPIELVERCILSMTNEGDFVLDPFSGVGSAMLAAVRHNRRAMGCERDEKYIEEAKRRMNLVFTGELPYRPLGKPVHQPTGKEKVSQIPSQWIKPKE
jgi:DNA modification methylase